MSAAGVGDRFTPSRNIQVPNGEGGKTHGPSAI